MATEGQLVVTVDAPLLLAPLSAAAEVAAYRIVQEALMNVAGHTRAQHCHIALELETADPQVAWLAVTVADNGVGLAGSGAGRHSSNADIARELLLSPKTVSNYLSNIFSKLQVVDRSQAIIRARQAGLGSDRD